MYCVPGVNPVSLWKLFVVFNTLIPFIDIIALSKSGSVGLVHVQYIQISAFDSESKFVTFDGGVLSPDWGWSFFLYIVPILTLTALGLYVVIKRLRIGVEPRERNKASYLLFALCVLTIFGLSGVLTPLGHSVPLNSIGALFAACIFAFAIIKHELVSINFILRRGLAWMGLLSVSITTYLVLFLFIHYLIGLEVKAATYTQLIIEKKDDNWIVQCLVDV